MAPRFLVGIDLGTTNIVVACARLDRDEEPEVFPLPQLITATEIAPRALLPAALYAPLEAEGVHSPWTEAPWAGGEYARRRGAEVTGRSVASAKSWLAHDAVDRHAAILPWGADEDVPRLSPVDASARYLEHVRRAWDAAHPEAPLAEQEVVLTVPASFDERRGELTLEAAHSVGLAPRLLEEPTAAFYDWMRKAGASGLQSLVGADGPALVLVCDVGGGTTDLSLIRIARAATPSGLEVTRVAVGRHLLLGGDNMDLALASVCEPRMTESKLDAARFAQLVAACRGAKEALLAKDAPEEVSIAIAGAGARLVGSTLRATLSREEAARIVLDGFWPAAPRGAEATRARAALVAFGLPYERDVAITRHVASFFARHATETAAERSSTQRWGLPRRADRVATGRVDRRVGGSPASPAPERRSRPRGRARRGRLCARAARTRGAHRRGLVARLLRRGRVR